MTMTRPQIIERCRVLMQEIEILETTIDDDYAAGFLGAAWLALDGAAERLLQPEEEPDVSVS